jgi:pheromone shutdown protein TraB
MAHVNKVRINIRIDKDIVEHFVAEAAKTLRSEHPAGYQTLINEAERDAFTIVLRDWRTLSPESRQQVIALGDEYESHIARVLDDLEGTGLIPENTRLFRLFLLGALNWTVQWYRADGDIES